MTTIHHSCCHYPIRLLLLDAPTIYLRVYHANFSRNACNLYDNENPYYRHVYGKCNSHAQVKSYRLWISDAKAVKDRMGTIMIRVKLDIVRSLMDLMSNERLSSFDWKVIKVERSNVTSMRIFGTFGTM
jgi:hypothetical protein